MNLPGGNHRPQDAVPAEQNGSWVPQMRQPATWTARCRRIGPHCRAAGIAPAGRELARGAIACRHRRDPRPPVPGACIVDRTDHRLITTRPRECRTPVPRAAALVVTGDQHGNAPGPALGDIALFDPQRSEKRIPSPARIAPFSADALPGLHRSTASAAESTGRIAVNAAAGPAHPPSSRSRVDLRKEGEGAAYGTAHTRSGAPGLRGGPRLHGDERLLRRARRRGVDGHHPPGARARHHVLRHRGRLRAVDERAARREGARRTGATTSSSRRSSATSSTSRAPAPAG